ncbi:MAG: bifunctional DNA-formamidopyrimidine glycosylase/DNA-(apurinic or apyrimidinic site) lyase [Patescibacteria group bacterium]|nr:bifunctional DNA-formamidopyrimidine glycosylase/DNA-(apurinic or apyrimidinic site) lyase [Patescibacteria group bacterium]
MPELPEVETIRRQLEKEVIGRRVEVVNIGFAGRLNVPAKRFADALKGTAFKSIGRRAKLLVLGFSNGQSVLVHLKLTGGFRLMPKGAVPGKHDHVVFRLSGAHDLFFSDFRKFGYLKLIPTKDVAAHLEKEGFGPEPLEKNFTAEKLEACLLRHPKLKVKQALMDQRCVAGVGNIYADESLWTAKIAPTRQVKSVKEREFARLREAVVTSLKNSIRRRGTSADNYFDLYGKEGTNVRYLNAYGREGEPCPRCGTPLKKIRLAGRGTVYCPKCQR